MALSRRKLTYLAFAFFVLIVTLYIVSPYYTVYAIKSAIVEGNSENLVNKIDFPQLRESIKANLNASLASDTINNKEDTNPLSMLGSGLASGFLSNMVDQYVTEEMLTMSMRNQNKSENKDSSNIFAIRKQLKESGISMGYSGLNHFIVNVDMGQEDAVKLIMGREGMFSWKIVKVDFGGFMASLLEGVEKSSAVESEKKHNSEPLRVPLETFIVNIGDSEGSRYLKITISLELDNKETLIEIENRMSSIRDSILTIIATKNYEQINTGQGKDNLKEEILRRINSLLPEGKVNAVYFDEFESQ